MTRRSDTHASTVRGVSITHPERVVFADLGLVKLDVVRYYDAVSPRMIPHLRDRPLTLVQCAPDAAHCRYLRHSAHAAPSQVRVVNIRQQSGLADYMIVDDASGLVALAQRNMIEFHTWNAKAVALEQPDRIVFDLDPGPLVPWAHVVAGAELVRATLRDVDLRCWVKTSGGRGLHVVVPIRPEKDWATCLAFAKAVASSLAAHDPTRYTVTFSKRGRERQILVDYLRNNRTNTSVAAYSLRARPQATVSMPLAWEELTVRRRPDRWTMATAAKRVASEPDPWAGYARTRQTLPR
jgi:bifunctional non-homologous end joining protein LigD